LDWKNIVNQNKHAKWINDRFSQAKQGMPATPDLDWTAWTIFMVVDGPEILMEHWNNKILDMAIALSQMLISTNVLSQ
jgi:hypothetical protein